MHMCVCVMHLRLCWYCGRFLSRSTRRKRKIRYWRNENTFNTRLIALVSSNKLRWHSMYLVLRLCAWASLCVHVHVMEHIEWSHLAYVSVPVIPLLPPHHAPSASASSILPFFRSFSFPCVSGCTLYALSVFQFVYAGASVWVNNNNIEPVYLFLLLHSWELFCVEEEKRTTRACAPQTNTAQHNRSAFSGRCWRYANQSEN